MSNHTPGPWMARQMFSGSWDIAAEDGDGSTIARTKDEANALLIAAAPDLLALCEACLSTGILDNGLENSLRLAIARAGGRGE